ncbi:hypothetical protein CL621_00115, partial [archaeon]|nr:hypothetical protein [archaeon]
LSKFLKGRTEEQWYSYYDSYTNNLKNKLDKPRENFSKIVSSKENLFKKNVHGKEKFKINKNILLLLVLVGFTFGILLFNNYTGYIIFENGSILNFGILEENTQEYFENSNSTECTGNWDAGQPCSNAYDGDWDTYALGDNEGVYDESHIYFNYTKPNGSLSSSLWQIKNVDGTYNITIDSNCWNLNPLRFLANDSCYGAIGCAPGKAGSEKLEWRCYNGTDWVGLWTPLVGTGLRIYEEAMWWSTTPPYFTSHLNNQTYPKKNEKINLSIDVNDGENIDFILFSTNDSGSWVNYSSQPTATTFHSNWTTLKVTSLEESTVGYAWFANDTDTNLNRSLNGTDIYYFFKVDGPPYFFNYDDNSAGAGGGGGGGGSGSWPKIGTDINLSIYINDSSLDFYVFSWNNSGSWVNDSEWTGGGASAVKNWTEREVTNAHATIGWQFWANDSTSDINNSVVQTFTVKNTIPVLTSNPTINDTTPNVEVVLNCTTGIFSDPDLDPQNNYWRWYMNVSELVAYTNYTLNLSMVAESYGDIFICSQKVYDNYDNSSNWYNSSSAIVTLVEEAGVINIEGTTRKITRTIVLDILTPAPVSIYEEDMITLPITIKNKGDSILRNINLKAISPLVDLSTFFVNPIIPSLAIGEEFKTDLIITSSSIPGSYEIEIIADIGSPKFIDTSKIKVDILEKGKLNQTIIVTRLNFAKDLFRDNPQCTTLDNLLIEANEKLENKDYEGARELTETAVRKCRDLVSPIILKEEVKPINYRLIITISIVIIILSLVGLITYRIIKPKKPIQGK